MLIFPISKAKNGEEGLSCREDSEICKQKMPNMVRLLQGAIYHYADPELLVRLSCLNSTRATFDGGKQSRQELF